LERAATEDMLDKSWERRSYLGVHPQKQEGLNFVGLHVPVGRFQAEDMIELARLAEQYGTQELRLTIEQNAIIPNVPTNKIEALLQEPLLQKFSPSPPLLLSTLVSCPGNQFCGLSIIETKTRALKITEELDRTMEVPNPVRMHWIGCPHTCGQVQIADIGFLGCMTKDENMEAVEGVDIFMGGRMGADSHLGDLIYKGVPCKDLVPVVQELLIKHFGAMRKVDI